jgi:hypothetical protein
MNAKILAGALAVMALAGPARADDKTAPAPTARESVMTFLRHLKETLAQSAVQGERKKGRVGSVAAVRGADQSSPLADPDEPVLIGDARSKKDKAALAEDAEFAKAVDLLLAGNEAGGIKALEDFKAKHPKSRNLDKVQQAIDQAKSLNAEKTAAAASPAPAASAPAPAAAATEAPKTGAPASK